MRDRMGLLIVAAGLTLTLLTRDKLGLVVAFAGVTLLAVFALTLPRSAGPEDAKSRRSSEPLDRDVHAVSQ